MIWAEELPSFFKSFSLEIFHSFVLLFYVTSTNEFRNDFEAIQKERKAAKT